METAISFAPLYGHVIAEDVMAKLPRATDVMPCRGDQIALFEGGRTTHLFEVMRRNIISLPHPNRCETEVQIVLRPMVLRGG